MIPLILLHIALAQATKLCMINGNDPKRVCQPIDTKVWGDNGNGGGEWGPVTIPPSEQTTVEHVIEIRTKREQKDCAQDKDSCICPDGYTVAEIGPHLDCPKVDRCMVSGGPICERTTKTLWIDGQRIGVIKETEEK